MIDIETSLPEVGKLVRKLGINRRGSVQMAVAEEVLRLSDALVPFDSGVLKQSAMIEDGGEIVSWNTPYARYQYYGMLMVDPKYKKGAMFNKEYGFWSRPGVVKELTDTSLHYQGQGTSHWVEVAMQNGGMEQVLEAARKKLRENSK